MDRSEISLSSGKTLPLVALRGACRFYGGVKAVAERCGIHDSALGRWLRGKPTLSIERVEAVLEALQMPQGEPETGIVYEWAYSVYWDDFKDALRLYFPNGGEFAQTGWSRSGLKNLAKFLTISQLRKTARKEIYIIKDDARRAIIRQPSGVLIHPDMFGRGFYPRGGKLEMSYFDLGRDQEAWLKGPVSVEQFDRGFGSTYLSWDDVFDAAMKKGLCPLDLMEVVERK